MPLRDALRMLRSEVGLTQTEFASAVYVSFSTVNRWENKGMRPNKMQSKAILDLAKQHHVSSACLDALIKCLLASRADDREVQARMKQEDERLKNEQRDRLTAEQFQKTMDNIDIALIGQRFYDRDPGSCDVFYHNGFFTKSFGYPAEELAEKIRQKPFFAVAPEYRQELTRSFGDLLSGKIGIHDFNVLVKAVRKDGSTFWYEVKAASMTEYSYGQEVFTACRDVTRRVEAEQRYQAEVVLRDASMHGMFSNIHCDLTADRVSHTYNTLTILGKKYDGEPLDRLLGMIADAAPDGAEKHAYKTMFSRKALLRAYDRGEVYGNAVLYNQNVRRWFRIEYLVLKNPVSGNIHALIYLFDIQKQVLSESMLGIFLKRFFDFVGLIDVDAETVEPYYYADGVFREQDSGKRHRYSEVCEEKLRRYGQKETAARESKAVALETVCARLAKDAFYTVILHLKDYDGRPLRKKITYTYLDGNKDMMIVAQSDLGQLTQFMGEHRAQYAESGACADR